MLSGLVTPPQLLVREDALSRFAMGDECTVRITRTSLAPQAL
jgi:hypothetical protein